MTYCTCEIPQLISTGHCIECGHFFNFNIDDSALKNGYVGEFEGYTTDNIIKESQ